MNKLYNKIYNAINEGVQKALIVKNDQVDDASVEWKKKQTSMKFDDGEKYINNIINAEKLSPTKTYTDIQCFITEQIKKYIQYCEDFNYKYMFKSFDKYNKLINIIKEYTTITTYEGVVTYRDKCINAQKIIPYFNFDNILSIILKNRTEIPISQYNGDGEFIKIKHDEYHEYILHVDGYIRPIKWTTLENTTDHVLFPGNQDDGYANTYNNKNIIRQNSGNVENRQKYFVTTWDNIKPIYNGNHDIFQNYPAFQYVDRLSDILNIYDYKAYIPSSTELSNVLQYIYIIHLYNIFTDINPTINYWTSTEVDVDHAKSVFYHQSSIFCKICTNYSKKTNIINILPFFKKITD